MIASSIMNNKCNTINHKTQELLVLLDNISEYTNDSDSPAIFADMSQLIIEGADINIVSQNNHTFLYLACMFINTDLINFCISNGADINFRGAQLNCMMILCFRIFRMSEKRLSCINILLDNGVDIKYQNNEGYNALMVFLQGSFRNYKTNHVLYNNIHDTLIYLITESDISAKNKALETAYDIYITWDHDILNENELMLLQGKSVFNNTKSSRK